MTQGQAENVARHVLAMAHNFRSSIETAADALIQLTNSVGYERLSQP